MTNEVGTDGVREPRVVAAGLSAVEGPVIGPDGWILNVCSMSRPAESWPTTGGDIVATHLSEPLRTVRVLNTSSGTVTGIPAALAFGPDGCLYVTDEGHRAILRVDPSRTATVFLDSYSGGRLNGPNDLSFDSEGNLFFTDPWGSSDKAPVGAVYGYCWSSEELTRIDEGMQFPNGIVVNDDVLYVAETYTRHVWQYEVTGAGKAQGRQVFCVLPHIEGASFQGPDGMALDVSGNLYVAHFGSSGIYVYSSAGELLDRLVVPGLLPTNVCFGGTDETRNLYVTIDDVGTLVELETQAKGNTLPFCPSTFSTHPFSSALVGLEEVESQSGKGD